MTYPAHRIFLIMLQTGFDRTEEELLKERAEALYHAGSELQDALQKLKNIEEDIETKVGILKKGDNTRALHNCQSGHCEEQASL